MKHIDKTQHLLPLGYLYLVVLGILKETAIFYQLDINILKYSSIMDVLISPIATATSNPVVFITIVAVFIFSYHLPSIIYKNDHKKWVQKAFELKKTKAETEDSEIKNYYLLISTRFLATFLLSIYLGYGSAEGYITSKKIKENKLHCDYKLNFNTGESEDVFLVESNSLYYFYVAKGEKHLKIAPISGIKNLVVIKNKK
ncbi:hypothetical protein [Flavobacterium terrisoli]|uniref:hypothetical protein n=1 Tax=Flavobacterium terrisoli TaxID=3242195 RepID=UPI002543A223|nr:hypothetical protein [Flavobacterium buctense]